MLTIQDYITCEGRYSLILAFHVRLLMVFEGRAINLPHFLLKSLSKMSKAYQRTSNPQSLFHHGLICIILKHELVKYHISWERFLSKIQLDDDKHIRNYSLPSEMKNSYRDVSLEPRDNLEPPKNGEKSSLDSHDLDEGKIDIDIVNFANKQNARLSSRITRNQKRKQNTPGFVDLN